MESTTIIPRDDNGFSMYNLDVKLQILRTTECKPFKTVGVVQFVTSRETFFSLVNKFVKQSNKSGKMKFDKIIVLGTFKGIIYNRIILIKYEEYKV